ncbi:MAG: hypothetical protein GW772_00900 [Flavobacteriia bacterium]|nr:hypothetical protein [Flavobacteriia bacterium]OIP46294.1 MAG: hypothetical protein AUK46_08725 [Flavobacteriaceae bacterium CG2_30_31_66]PIV95664.1 MAG: hypothetical protein COW43_11920 [Flavobacteriaceae bacterium CG17_big_fil_post_rev_8_21_14_2_50_31_13]PIX12656.1 MAG: hypothetical protein COZ74_10390 [Flavobacteriaceae bacterium CG_4_8_14_3_um_filter_31_8]PIY15562.1 MAG: hypothetical protein COZ16_03345 [Flavobacteriaceae bacterium CG_4_10_14_3_um_filter_31_253]PIZ09233.1 MAG: hypotheti
MKRDRKIYEPALKIKAAKLSKERTNITELSKYLGIKVGMLYRYRKEYNQFGKGNFLGKGVLKKTS